MTEELRLRSFHCPNLPFHLDFAANTGPGGAATGAGGLGGLLGGVNGDGRGGVGGLLGGFQGGYQSGGTNQFGQSTGGAATGAGGVGGLLGGVNGDGRGGVGGLLGGFQGGFQGGKRDLVERQSGAATGAGGLGGLLGGVTGDGRGQSFTFVFCLKPVFSDNALDSRDNEEMYANSLARWPGRLVGNYPFPVHPFQNPDFSGRELV